MIREFGAGASWAIDASGGDRRVSVESPLDLSMGAILGDYTPAIRAWEERIARLQLLLERADVRFAGPLALNVVYFVDGKLIPLTFSGVRTGRSDMSVPALVVQAAIPPQADVAMADDVLFSLLNDAVDAAERWSKRKGLGDRLTRVREIVDTVLRSSA